MRYRQISYGVYLVSCSVGLADAAEPHYGQKVNPRRMNDELNCGHIQFDGIHDYWNVYHHKGVKKVTK